MSEAIAETNNQYWTMDRVVAIGAVLVAGGLVMAACENDDLGQSPRRYNKPFTLLTEDAPAQVVYPPQSVERLLAL